MTARATMWASRFQCAHIKSAAPITIQTAQEPFGRPAKASALSTDGTAGRIMKAIRMLKATAMLVLWTEIRIPLQNQTALAVIQQHFILRATDLRLMTAA